MRTLIAVGLAITMIFAVVGLSACNTDLTLEQQADALGQQVYAALNGGNPTDAKIDALLEELAELRVEVIRLQGDNAALLERIDGYKAQLEALRNRGNLVERDWGYSECKRFALSIAVEETTLPQGEDFVVNVQLRNTSDEDHEITYDKLFLPYILDWCFFGGHLRLPPWALRSRVIEANSVFCRNISTDPFGDLYFDCNEWLVGGVLGRGEFGEVLAQGTHDLTFRVAFSFPVEQHNHSIVEFKSNTVVLTVT